MKNKIIFILSNIFLVLVIFNLVSKKDTVDNNEATDIESIDAEINSINLKEDKNNKYYLVKNVVDGDTIKLEIDGAEETLRLIGLDTPETVDPRKTVQCFGKEASNKAKEMLLDKYVYLEFDETQDTRDKYGRLLAYVYTKEGIFYNKYMIEQGYGREYTYEIPYMYQSEFKEAQNFAKDNQKGLWSPDNCNEPEVAKNTQISDTRDTNIKYYTSTHYSSKYYYPESCKSWKNLSSKYLKGFETIEELLKSYNRALSPDC